MIRLDNIGKKYNKSYVIKDLSLHVYAGDIYGLVGKNGAGKTTLFKLILGLSEADNGTVWIQGENSIKKICKKRKDIGFFIGNNFYDYLSARENLEYYCRIKGIEKKEVDRVLSLVGLLDAKAPYKTFSMGMKQRLGIANAILGNPQIVILDEPINGLDPQGIADIRNLILKLNAEMGTTFIISSHILGELENTATKFGILDHGCIVKEISKEELNKTTKEITVEKNDYERAVNLLNEHGIEILQNERKQNELEEFYFDVVGGEEA